MSDNKSTTRRDGGERKKKKGNHGCSKKIVPNSSFLSDGARPTFLSKGLFGK